METLPEDIFSEILSYLPEISVMELKINLALTKTQ